MGVDDADEDPEGDCGMKFKRTEVLADEVPVDLHGSADELRTSRKAIARYGLTTGCLGCYDIARRNKRTGTIIYTYIYIYIYIYICTRANAESEWYRKCRKPWDQCY